MQKTMTAAFAGALLLLFAGPANAQSPTPNAAPAAPVVAPAPVVAAPVVVTPVAAAPPAAAAVADPPDGLTEESFKAILKLFVLAVVLESALALLFNWRPFIVVFDGRGVKSLVSLAASLIVVFTFKVDVMGALLTAYDGVLRSSAFSQILTAMVIAGGSSGVNNMLRSLGYRPINRPEDVSPKPPPGQAWLSVAIVARRELERFAPVAVEIMEDGASYRIAGVIKETSRRSPVLGFFFRDLGRLPPSGGIALKPDTAYQVRVTGRRADGTHYASEPWGPASFRAGAIVDIEFKA